MAQKDNKVVLIVDDEEIFLRTVAEGFSLFARDVTPLTARNGRVALEVLRSRRVDLVVTDLKMPEMDGFALIAEMSRHHPGVPVIVMSAFGTPDIEARLVEQGVVQYLDKPIDFEHLAEKVVSVLAASASGHLRGIALPTVLQMIEADRKTCTVRVSSRGHDGELAFKGGLLADARTGDLQGTDAAMEIVCWKEPEIDILPGPSSSGRALEMPVTQILLEAFRVHDERERQRQRERRKAGARHEPPAEPVPSRKTVPPARASSAPAGPATVKSSTKTPFEEPRTDQKDKERIEMSAQEKLKELAAIDGFSGVAVYTPQGELLAAHTGDVANLKEIGVLANNVLMNAQKASLEMGTGRGQQVHVEAESSHILVRCLNEGTDPLRSQPNKAHIHMVVVLKSDAAIGMAKLRVGTVIQKLAEDFRM